jgi:hypothetical protein
VTWHCRAVVQTEDGAAGGCSAPAAAPRRARRVPSEGKGLKGQEAEDFGARCPKMRLSSRKGKCERETRKERKPPERLRSGPP